MESKVKTEIDGMEIDYLDDESTRNSDNEYNSSQCVNEEPSADTFQEGFIPHDATLLSRTDLDHSDNACILCHKQFSSKSNLNRHIRSHYEKKSLECPNCLKEFKQRSTLNRHVARECKYTVSSNSEESKHLEQDSGQKSSRRVEDPLLANALISSEKHGCRHCCRRFSSIELLNLHLEEHERLGVTENTTQAALESPDGCSINLSPIEGKKANKKLQTCTVCGVGYASAHKLTQHYLKHAEEAVVSKNAPDDNVLSDEPELSSADNPIFGSKGAGKRAGVEENASSINAESSFQDGVDKNGAQIHKCVMCAKQFPTIAKLFRHMEKHASQLQSNYSRVMDALGTVPASSTLQPTKADVTDAAKKSDKVLSSDEPIYDCHICERHFSTRSNLNRHVRSHSGGQFHECVLCQKKFTQKTSLVRHLTTHGGERPFNCHECGENFARKSNVLQHLRVVHSGEKPHFCTVCSRSFSYKSSLVKHRRMHNGDMPYECPECNERFLIRTQLTKHLKSHVNEPVYECNQCDKWYVHENDLIDHLAEHSAAKCHECSQCGKKFLSKSNLARHAIIHGDKQHECHACGRMFSDKSCLKRHFRLHAREKCEECRECGEKFALRTELSRHLAVHEKTRPHKCTHCGKRFSYNCTLARHLLSHSGEKPHQCMKCGKCFSDKSVMARHAKGHEPKIPSEALGKDVGSSSNAQKMALDSGADFHTVLFNVRTLMSEREMAAEASNS